MYTLREYMYIQSLATGITYESEIIKYFNIDTTLTYEDIQNELADRMAISDYQLNKKFYLNNKYWMFETDFLEGSYEQWSRLESLLNDNNTQNLHRILAIYCRPATINKLSRKFTISKFDLNRQEKIANELLDLPMSIEKELISAFFLLGIKCLNYIKIYFLNQMNK